MELRRGRRVSCEPAAAPYRLGAAGLRLKSRAEWAFEQFVAASLLGRKVGEVVRAGRDDAEIVAIR